MRRDYCTLDVFTEAPLAGNPLAVVLDAEGSTTRACRGSPASSIFRRRCSSTSRANPVNTAAVRIFTPARELPFAGHPTVGAAALLAHLRAPELLAAQDLRLVLEEKIGEVVCVARHRRGQAMARLFHPAPPAAAGGRRRPVAEIAAGLGLEPADIGFGAPSSRASTARASLLFVPIAQRRGVGQGAARSDAFGARMAARASISTRARSPTPARPIARACSPPAGASGKTRRPAPPPRPSRAS